MNVIISNKYQLLLGTLSIDVIKTLNGVFTTTDIINQFSNFFYDKMIIDITAIKDYENISTIQELSLNLDMSKIIFLLDDSEFVNSPKYLSQMVSMGIYNFTKKADSISFLINNPNSYKDVAVYQQLDSSTSRNLMKFNSKVEMQETTGFIGQRVIGVKNVTGHAGSTTLTYLLKKHLEKYYTVKTVELDRNDFLHFNDNSMQSIASNDLQAYISKNTDVEVVLVDLNNYSGPGCTEILYLIEPGIIKLNKLIKTDSKVFEKLRNSKVVLNRSILNNKDVTDFEKESDSNIFANIPNLDDKLNNNENINTLLISLGFTRLSDDAQNNGLFGMF